MSASQVSLEQEAWSAEPSFSGLSEQRHLCVDCDPEDRRPATLSCLKCDAVFCNDCWADRKRHKRGDPTHRRAPILGSQAEDLVAVFRRLQDVFYEHAAAPQVNEPDERYEQHHRILLATLWLAITTSPDDDDSPLSFNERPVYGNLIGEYMDNVQWRPEDKDRTLYPRLVSFVGGTGAGKSSVMKILIRHLWDSTLSDEDVNYIPVPVVGARSSQPTSSDIHLYHDPIEAKRNPKSPLLFADCEGFGTGKTAISAESRADWMVKMKGEAPDNIREDAKRLAKWAMNAFNNTMGFIERNLTWSDSNKDRDNVVEELFPKLVYNISDVVVYVVNETNLKTIDKILLKLVEWSQKIETSSVNRTSLPSLIILVNQCDPASTTEWGPDATTNEILKENACLMKGKGMISDRKDKLKSLGLPHESIKDVLEISYAAVKFLRIPNALDISRLRSQFQELHAMIDSMTKATHDIRKANNMLLNAEQLHDLYRLTFDHFSRSTTSPFDFMEAFFAVHPSSAELSGNVFELLQATFAAVKHSKQTACHQPFADEIIKATVPIICSAVAMDSHERQIPGPLSTIFSGNTSERPSTMRKGTYEGTVEEGLQMFADSTLPCGYRLSPSPGNEEKQCVNNKTKLCVNGRRAHSSEGFHQDADGVRFGYGSFDPSLEKTFRIQWGEAITKCLDSLNAVSVPELYKSHREAVRRLHSLVPKVDLRRLPGCVWCMYNTPTERLPCGHWICSSCVVRIGRRDEEDERVLTIELCDQHSEGGKRLDPPFEFLHLPKNVGRRLLSLDEGGVRGILQLELLAALQDKVGPEIPVQNYFDLIGGTGIGGINALGLGLTGRDVSEAVREFGRLVPEAFVKQGSRNFIESFFLFILWPIYQPARVCPYAFGGLVQCIQNAFGDDSEQPMATTLSQGTKAGSGPTRVFVTSFRKGSGGMLLANYRRQPVDDEQGQAPDPNRPQIERRTPRCTEVYSIGEAAKATACFEWFFGSCNLSPGNHVHTGGADYTRCPAGVTLLEAQSLWPHMPDGRPDVLISVGCGHDARKTPGNPMGCADTEATWSEAFGRAAQVEPGRYIRLCPEFVNPGLPEADDVSFLTSRSRLSVDARRDRLLGQDDILTKVDRIARRLISTSFYFEKASTEWCKDGTWIIPGNIRCRFKETSQSTKALGERISKLKNPRFVCGSEEVWSFDEVALKDMMQQGKFRAPYDAESVVNARAQLKEKVSVKFAADDFPAEDISGC